MSNKLQFDTISEIVCKIPHGKVMSYGQVAAIARCPARTVGWAMATIDAENVPWYRVVGSDGYLRIGRRSATLQALQRELLEKELVEFLENDCVDMARFQYRDGDDQHT